MSEVGEKLIAAIVAAAEKNPNKIVKTGGCEYVDSENRHLNGQYCGSCIVGVALFDSGLLNDDNVEEFLNMRLEKYGDDYFNTQKFDAIAFQLDFLNGITRQEVEWILEAQNQQDDQKIWAHAVREADLHYGKEVGRK